jgi:uncharacterized membrane protein YhdT
MLPMDFFDTLSFFGVWLWGIGLICLFVWLLTKREPMLTSSIAWKPMTFISLTVALGLTLLYLGAIFFIYAYDSDFRGLFIFLFMAGVLLPLVFIASAGIGLAYSIVKFRARLDKEGRSLALVISAAMIVGSLVLTFAALDHSDIRF